MCAIWLALILGDHLASSLDLHLRRKSQAKCCRQQNMLPLPDWPSRILDLRSELPAALPAAEGKQALPALAVEHAELHV